MKKHENPFIDEITKTYTKRIFHLSSIKLPEGLTKKCVWCLGELKGAQRRWCGDECVESAQAWAHPQKEQGLWNLFQKQDFKCKSCQFDYAAVIEEMFKQPKLPYGFKEYKDTWRTKFSYWVITKLKQHLHASDPEHNPEVDHVVPIYKGGLSLSVDNLQCICYTCHKVKTKTDLSGKRKKNEQIQSE